MKIRDIAIIVGAVVIGNVVYDKLKSKIEKSGLGGLVGNYFGLGEIAKDPTNQFPVKEGSFGPEYRT